ncbi:MAG: hypothetical protein KDA53_00130 [Hyphomonas sp.]|nr:hypothetical protein [Hyphomonas sp.]
MTELRKLKITPTVSKGATIVFSIQGRSTNFQDRKPIAINIEQDGCYDVVVVCIGNSGNKASVKFEAVHKDFGVYVCTPSGKPSWTDFSDLETKIPTGESAWLSASKISIRKKSDKPAN